jgi:pyruvate dehydrogenase E1 component
MTQVEHLKSIEKQLLWTSHWMIHNANNLRSKEDGVKVGGHQASSASMVSIMTALYFSALRPEDRVAVKPHAAPVFHAIQYLMGNQTLENIKNFRGFGGAQSYPSRTKDIDEVDFSTGSVGLGVGITAFASMVQDFISTKKWHQNKHTGRMVALVGDAELDEGNIYETLQEGWKHDLRNCWWIIDYNRQSLDGVIREGLWQRIEGIFADFGWNVLRLKYGAKQKAAFAQPGGADLKNWIDNCPNQLYSALTYQGASAWRERLLHDAGERTDFTSLIESRSDAELSELMENLGGHCIETLSEAFSSVTTEKPTCFLAYTVKGWGTPLAGHKDNHSGLMNFDQMTRWQTEMGVIQGNEWDRFSTIGENLNLRKYLGEVPFFKGGERRFSAKKIPIPAIKIPPGKEISTQAAFGKIMFDLSRDVSGMGDRILTTSPDVTVSTGLGGWVNRKGIFARSGEADLFADKSIPSTQKWQLTPEGQHLELGIAEMNLFLALGAAGLSHSLFGERLLPIGTVYDPFIARGLDALNYACYQDARFMIIGTPSGISLAPEGGAHQSIGTPLIGMTQAGMTSFEPAFADELATIMEWGFQHMQADDGGSIYLRLSTRVQEQPMERIADSFRDDVINGAYWWRKPGPNCDFVIAYQGAVANEAITAAGIIGDDYRDLGVLAVTSADKLHASWRKVQAARRDGQVELSSHIEQLMAELPSHCRIVTVIDGHPSTLSWLGGVYGNQTISLGVDDFGQTGSISDLYQHFDINAEAIVKTVDSFSRRRRLCA